jgi:hypothetical protein
VLSPEVEQLGNSSRPAASTPATPCPPSFMQAFQTSCSVQHTATNAFRIRWKSGS